MANNSSSFDLVGGVFTGQFINTRQCRARQPGSAANPKGCPRLPKSAVAGYRVSPVNTTPVKTWLTESCRRYGL